MPEVLLGLPAVASETVDDSSPGERLVTMKRFCPGCGAMRQRTRGRERVEHVLTRFADLFSKNFD